ncbi:MAG TPA: 6-carboxytetrahydropterin synthase [Methylomirabilota bacterium]|jgi:6-pyruvoyltetrahydropterin/6-carboxytetrahydropterin synthase
MELTKVLRFSAAHRLTSPALSRAENRRVYGPCVRDHGHNYALEATVRGVVDADGMVMDVAVLEQAMRTVVDLVDHRDLGRDVPALAGTVTTGENLAATFYWMIARALPSGRLVRVAVVETDNNRFECEATGETP